MKLLIALLLTLFLTGCAAEAAPVETTVPETTAAETTLPETIAVEAEAEALMDAPEPALPVILECSAPGLDAEVSDTAEIDYSNRADGYVMVRYTAETEKRLKVRVSRQTTYTYNLTPGQWTVFPLSDGDGDYRVTIYRNTSGSEYATIMSCSFSVTLADEFAPFLRPNQYVDYSCAPEAMALGTALCTGIDHPLEKVAAVYDYVVAELSYDYDKASTVKSGYLPVLAVLLGVMLAGFLVYRFVPPARNYVNREFQKNLGDRGLLWKFNNARFARALAMGIGSGMTAEEALSLAGRLLADLPGAAGRCDQAEALLEKGEDLSVALEKTNLLPPARSRMLAVGLRSGNVDKILTDVADRMETDARQALEDWLSHLEPALVLLSAAMVGVILLSVMVPLLDILSVLG